MNTLEIYEESNCDIATSLGGRFREYRIKSQLTQRDLSERTGIAVSTISNFENGQQCNIGLHTFIALMRGIGQLEQLQELLPELPLDPSIVFKYNKEQKQRVRHGK